LQHLAKLNKIFDLFCSLDSTQTESTSSIVNVNSAAGLCHFHYVCSQVTVLKVTFCM